MLAAAMAIGAARGQEPVEFRTPDGTRVVLLQVPGPPLVHWAIATPCGPLVDPIAAPGMAAATVMASLRGTWTTGSRDAAKERAAIEALDKAETDLRLAPRDGGAAPADLAARVAELRTQAAALGDPLVFRRVLAAVPTQDLEVHTYGDTAVLQLTTVPFAVPVVARLLAERREEPALRSVRDDLQTLQDRATAEWDQEPLAPLWAEVQALAFPGHPLARAGDRPVAAGFQRDLATSTWARSQHPSRSVHVLVGGFDQAVVRQALESAFATTALAKPDVQPLPPPRAPTALRRSLVPGARHPAAVLAFVVPIDADPAAVATAGQWLAGGNGSWLHTELVRQGRKNVRLRVRAPWPEGVPGGLLAIEVSDPSGGAAAIADEVLQLCAGKQKKEPRQGDLAAAYGTVLRAFEQRTRRPGDQAALFAARLLQLPEMTVPGLLPRDVAFPAVPALLQKVLDGNPIVIEWRDK